MTRDEATATLNRARGLLVHFRSLVRDPEAKRVVDGTLRDLDNLERSFIDEDGDPEEDESG